MLRELSLEYLESRWLLCSYSYDSEHKVLTVDCLGSSADTVTASLDGTSLRITDNGGSILDSTSSPPVPASTLKALRIQTRGGNDVVNLSAMTTSDFPDLPEITVLTGAGDDTVTGNNGTNGSRIFAFLGAGADTFNGSSAADAVDGGSGRDTISGLDGNDYIQGEGDEAELYVNLGNDEIADDDDKDTIHGGNGNDTIYGFMSGDSPVNCEDGEILNGNDGDDNIHGSDGADIISGNNGNDGLDGGDGNDVINGNLGDDTISGDDGIDVIHGNEDDDTISGGDGNDELYGDEDSDHIFGGAGDDQIYGGTGTDTLAGGSGDDHIEGGSGADRLDGGYGADYLYGYTQFNWSDGVEDEFFASEGVGDDGAIDYCYGDLEEDNDEETIWSGDFFNDLEY